MVELKDTAHITKAAKITAGRKSYYQVPAFGDGNCSLNSLALALIDLIKRDQLHLNEVLFQKFLQHIRSTMVTLEQRLALYQNKNSRLTGAAYRDVAKDLQKFITFIKDHNKLTFDDFKRYVNQQKSREEIAALHVALAPALRNKGAEIYEKKLTRVADDERLIGDAKSLYHDGVWAGHDVLMHLARDFFGINLKLYDKADNFQEKSATDLIAGAPEVALVHSPGHWDYLLPEDQEDGLAVDLKERSERVRIEPIASQGAIKDENETLLTFGAYLAQIDIQKFGLDEMTKVVKTTTQNLVVLNEDEVRGEQANKIAESSEAVIEKVRSELNLNEDQLSSFNLSKMQKELITKGPVEIDPNDADAALARAVQNAEILEFLNNNYEDLKSPSPKPRMK